MSGFRPDCLVFQCPVWRPAKHQAGRIFVLLFETIGLKSGVLDQSTLTGGPWAKFGPPETPPPPASRRSGVCYDRAHMVTLVGLETVHNVLLTTSLF